MKLRNNKTLPYVAAAVAVAGGAYLYFRSKKAKQTTTETPVEPVVEPQKVVTVKQVAPPVDPWKTAAFDKVVRNVQLFLGVGVDGNPGRSDASQTNQALKKKFPAEFAKYGAITPTNQKEWASIVESTQSKTKMSEYLQSTAPGRQKFGEDLWNLGVVGKRIALRSGKMTVPFRVFDAARKIYVVSGKNATLSATDRHLFAVWDRVGYDGDGFWILRYKANPKQFIIVNPNVFGAF